MGWGGGASPSAAGPSGALSAVKVCGGTEAQSSKSSGARRLTPMREEEEEEDSGMEGVVVGVRWRSGVRALNTGMRDSGVFGRLVDEEGPETRRERDSGVFGRNVGIGTGGMEAAFGA